MTIKVFEMFSDFNGASFGLKKAGIDFECVGFSEIDKGAIKFTSINFPNYKNYGDCTNINPHDLPDFDLLTGGFPCQTFSIAGSRDGFNDPRGNLFLEICRIAEIKKPKYMLLENVKGLVNHDDGKTFKIILNSFKRLGYGVAYKVLNSKDFGIPQNRERIWFVCKLGGWDFMEFQFPHEKKLEIFVKDLLDEQVDDKYYLSEKALKRLNDRNNLNNEVMGCMTANQFKQNWNTPLCFDFRNDEGMRIRKDGTSPCLFANMKGGNGDDLSNRIMVYNLQPRCGEPTKGGTGLLKKNDGTTYCLDTGNTQAIQIISSLQTNSTTRNDGVVQCLTSVMGLGGGHIPMKVEFNKNIRRLTPKECFKLMGFSEQDNLKFGDLSDTSLYKLAGNGWDINVVSLIFKEMFKNATL